MKEDGKNRGIEGSMEDFHSSILPRFLCSAGSHACSALLPWLCFSASSAPVNVDGGARIVLITTAQGSDEDP